MVLDIIVVVFVLALILTLAVMAIVRGCRGIIMSGRFTTTNKKVKTGYYALSIVQLILGVLITTVYLVVGILSII